MEAYRLKRVRAEDPMMNMKDVAGELLGESIPLEKKSKT